MQEHTKLTQIQENQENQENFQKTMKKPTLIKRQEQVPCLFNFMKLFKLSDSLFEKLEKGTQKELSTDLCSDLYSKTIKKIQYKNDYVQLIFKKYKTKLKEVKKYSEDLKLLDDPVLYDLAVYIECLHVHGQENQISQFRKNNFKDSSHRSLLPQMLQKLKNKQFILILMDKVNDDLIMDKVIISRQLLKTTGYSDQEIFSQYLKYGHVFFQILGKQFYFNFCRTLGFAIKKFVENKEVTIGQNDKHKKFFLQFEDFILKKGENSQEFRIKSKIQFYKPHQKMTVFQFQIYEHEHEYEAQIQQKNVQAPIIFSQKQKIQSKILEDQAKSLNKIIDLLKCVSLQNEERRIQMSHQSQNQYDQNSSR